jgi:hypothetical protein
VPDTATQHAAGPTNAALLLFEVFDPVIVYASPMEFGLLPKNEAMSSQYDLAAVRSNHHASKLTRHGVRQPSYL